MKANLFLLVRDLERARKFYDLLLGPAKTCAASHITYQVGELVLRFYSLSAQQARRYRMTTRGGRSLPRQGVSLEDSDWDSRLACLIEFGAKLEIPWGVAPWGGYFAHITDSDGHRWELASPAVPQLAQTTTRESGKSEPSFRD